MGLKKDPQILKKRSENDTETQTRKKGVKKTVISKNYFAHPSSAAVSRRPVELKVFEVFEVFARYLTRFAPVVNDGCGGLRTLRGTAAPTFGLRRWMYSVAGMFPEVPGGSRRVVGVSGALCWQL